MRQGEKALTVAFKLGAMMQMRKIDLEKMRQAADDVSKTVITVQAIVNAPIGKVWEYWSTPAHIMQWNSASPDWHTPMRKTTFARAAVSAPAWRRRTAVSA